MCYVQVGAKRCTGRMCTYFQPCTSAQTSPTPDQTLTPDLTQIPTLPGLEIEIGRGRLVLFSQRNPGDRETNLDR